MSISTEMSTTLDVSVPGFSPTDRASAHTLQRLALPYELLLQRPTPMELDTLLQTTVNWLVDVIPDATHGALMLKEPATGDLSLRVHRPIGEPVISLTLVQQAMEKQAGVIWRRGEAEMSASDLPQPITSGIYVPLIWQGEPLGVMCVHTCHLDSTLTSDDLDVSLAAAHHAALALAYHALETRLRHATGIRLRRDSWVSVMYAEELNSTTSSVTLQRTDRHGIVVQKSADLQLFL